MFRFNLRHVFIVVTLVCVCVGSVSTWHRYQRDQQARGFIDGVKQVVEQGSIGAVYCGFYYDSTEGYERGFLDGQAFLGVSTMGMSKQERLHAVNHALRATKSIDRRLALRTLRALER